MAGFSDDPILEAVHRQFAGSKATKSDVGYNRSKLKRDGFAGQVRADPDSLLPPAKSGKPPSPPKPVKGQPELPWETGHMKVRPASPAVPPGTVSVPTGATIASLRSVVIKKASSPALSALLTMALDVIEKL